MAGEPAHVLLETPIAHRLLEADAIIQAAARNCAKIEVSEQFHRRPLEAIKLALIRSACSVRLRSFNDFAGHGYHGVSVMRSYLRLRLARARDRRSRSTSWRPLVAAGGRNRAAP